eukprot:Skav227984  [mRNA]  locus=scaffold1165:435755:453141:- [translate_table: standard]
MWSLAFDVREDCEPGQDLRAGDFVVFHYTNKKFFELITKLSGAELRASFRVEDNKDSYFGHGIYAAQKAPHQWSSKDHLLVNNFWPARKVFQEECPDEPFPDDGDIESLVNDKDGAAFKRLQNLFGELWEYCIPLIVDQQVAKNVMTEPTDAPLMPKDDHGKRKKRLAGYNRRKASQGEAPAPKRAATAYQIFTKERRHPSAQPPQDTTGPAPPAAPAAPAADSAAPAPTSAAPGEGAVEKSRVVKVKILADGADGTNELSINMCRSTAAMGTARLGRLGSTKGCGQMSPVSGAASGHGAELVREPGREPAAG